MRRSGHTAHSDIIQPDVLSSVDDTADLAEQEASTQLAALAVQAGKTGATVPA